MAQIQPTPCSVVIVPALFVQTLENRSLVKYLLIIEEFGGWPLYQELLQVLKSIATRHTPLKGEPVSVSMVAIQYILCQEQVEAVIIGSHDSKYVSPIYSVDTSSYGYTFSLGLHYNMIHIPILV